MAETETASFVCTQCWNAFGYPEDSLGPGQESVVCPHCGADVPIPPGDEAIGGPSPVVSGGPAAASDAPKAAAEQSPMAPAEPEQAASTPSTEAVRLTPEVPEIDPEDVVWKLLIPGGLTYNFHGLGALMRWSTGKRNLSEVAVSLDGARWVNFGHFQELISGGLAVGAAIQQADLAAGGLGDRVDPSASSRSPTRPSDPATAAAPAAGGAGAHRKGTTAYTLGGAPPRGIPSGALPQQPAAAPGMAATSPRIARPVGGPPSQATDDEELREAQRTVDDPQGSGGFTFSVTHARGGSDWRGRVLFLALGVLTGLGVGALLHVLHFWDKILPR